MHPNLIRVICAPLQFDLSHMCGSGKSTHRETEMVITFVVVLMQMYMKFGEIVDPREWNKSDKFQAANLCMLGSFTICSNKSQLG